MRTSRENLIRIFQDLYLLEKQACDLYSEYLKELDGQNAHQIVQKIRDDEKHHMEIAKKLENLCK